MGLGYGQNGGLAGRMTGWMALDLTIDQIQPQNIMLCGGCAVCCGSNLHIFITAESV